MKWLWTILLMLGAVAHGQTVLLMHDVESDVDDNQGPGKRFYNGAMVTLGMMAGPGENDSIRINYGKSFEIGYGVLGRVNLTRFFGLGAYGQLQYRQYSIKQETPKVFSNSLLHDRERLWMGGTTVGVFTRWSFLKRGDDHGLYIDIGGSVGYNFWMRHVYRDQLDPAFSSVKTNRVANSKLQYVNRLEYHGEVRLGFKALFIGGRYRASDHFRSYQGNLYPELPRITVFLGGNFL